jgi:hypothetical protein
VSMSHISMMPLASVEIICVIRHHDIKTQHRHKHNTVRKYKNTTLSESPIQTLTNQYPTRTQPIQTLMDFRVSAHKQSIILRACKQSNRTEPLEPNPVIMITQSMLCACLLLPQFIQPVVSKQKQHRTIYSHCPLQLRCNSQ